MVLTFDLQFEYMKRIFSPRALPNLFMYFLFAPALHGLVLWMPKFFMAPRVGEFERVEAYQRCLNTSHIDDLFCHHAFSKEMLSRGLYNTVADHVTDINYVSVNFYSSYSPLLIILAIVLTFALLAALGILKIK